MDHVDRTEEQYMQPVPVLDDPLRFIYKIGFHQPGDHHGNNYVWDDLLVNRYGKCQQKKFEGIEAADILIAEKQIIRS